MSQFEQFQQFSQFSQANATAAGAAGITANLDDLTPALLATITGKPAPTLMWLGKDASGADELVVGTDDLADVGPPLKQVTSTELAGTVTELDDLTDSMNAASGTVADVGNVTVTFMMIHRLTLTTGTRMLFGKRDAVSPNHGYELTSTSGGGVSWTIDGPSGLTVRTIATGHGTVNPQVVLGTRSIANDVASLWSREGSSEGTRNSESITSSDTMAVGNGRLSARLHEFGLLAIWLGTDGDGFGEPDRLAVAQALGYE